LVSASGRAPTLAFTRSMNRGQSLDRVASAAAMTAVLGTEPFRLLRPLRLAVGYLAGVISHMVCPRMVCPVLLKDVLR
jgi:hypothetical protein